MGRRKHLKVEWGYTRLRAGPQLAAGKQNGWRCPEKFYFLLGPVLATGLRLGCCEAHVDLLLEKRSIGDMAKKGARREKVDWGRMLTSVSEATWR